MKQTHKLRALGDVGAVISSAKSLTDAARQLGVDRSTIHRWIVAGKAPKPGGRSTPLTAAGSRQAPETWARAVRRAYQLDVTEQALVDLATRALTLARDEKTTPAARLAAMGRFQALVKQLNLEFPANGEAQAPNTSIVRTWPRRVVG